MIYEVRTYTLKPGSVPTFEENFAKALPHRLKYSPLAAFWHTEVGPLNQVIHVWPYESLDERTRIRAEAATDPNWPPANDPDMYVNMESEIFIPAPFMRRWAATRSWATSTRCAPTPTRPAPWAKSSSAGRPPSLTARSTPPSPPLGTPSWAG